MATYNVQKSAGGLAVAIPDAASPDTQTDLHLVGQNAVSYGLDVAQSFYFLLENFANTSAPSVGGVDGQLWFDTTAGVLVLKVWDGTTWKSMAHTAVATTDDSMTRWDDTAQEWQENTHLSLSSAGVLTLRDSTDADTITFTKVTSGALTIAATNTTDITFSGLTGDLTIIDGRGLSVEDSGTALAIRAVSGTTSIDFSAATTTDLNLPSGATLNTAASASGRAGINIAEGTAPSSPNDGDVWVTAAGNFFARLNGVSVDLSAASGTVTSSGSPLINEVAVFSTGTNILSDSTFTWDGSTMFATNVTGTNIGGIASANLVDRATPGTLAATIFSGNITAQADILLGDNDEIIFGTGSDVLMDFDTADFVINAASAVNFDITGFSGAVISDAPIHATSAGAESFRVLGDNAVWASADSYISFYDSTGSTLGLQIGTLVADSGGSRINAQQGNLDLYASNTEVLALTATTSTMSQAGSAAMEWRAITGSNISTSASVYDATTARNVGYNETPTSTLTTKTIVIDDIGKFLTRTGSAAAVLTLANVPAIPVGGSCVVHNGHSSNTLTIARGGMTLNWIDGSGSVPTDADRTIAYNSVVTLRKVSSTVWQIWGNGIS